MFLKKGFIEENSHHKYYIYYLDGKKTNYYAYLSHGHNNEVDSFILGSMSKTLQLPKEDLIKVITCTIDKNQLKQYYLVKEQKQKGLETY